MLVVHYTDLWIIEHMVESANRAAEVGAVLDSVQQPIRFVVRAEP